MKNQISELMDGELEAGPAARVLRELADSAEHRADWTLYHMIGDGLRDAPDLSASFGARFGERLAAEPTVLSPRPPVSPRAGVAQFAMYAAAALAAVAVVGWFAVAPQLTSTAPQLAQQSPGAIPVAAAPRQPAMSPLKPRDQDYLLAHQAVSPSSTMPGVAPYVRTVSFGTEPNGR